MAKIKLENVRVVMETLDELNGLCEDYDETGQLLASRQILEDDSMLIISNFQICVSFAGACEDALRLVVDSLEEASSLLTEYYHDAAYEDEDGNTYYDLAVDEVITPYDMGNYKSAMQAIAYQATRYLDGTDENLFTEGQDLTNLKAIASYYQ